MNQQREVFELISRLQQINKRLQELRTVPDAPNHSRLTSAMNYVTDAINKLKEC